MFVENDYICDGLFKFWSIAIMLKINKNDSFSTYILESFNLWHSRLGHVNYDTLCRLINLKSIRTF